MAWPGQGGVAEKINQDNHQLSASQLNLSLHQFVDNVNNGDRDNGEDDDVGGFVFLQASISPLIPILWYQVTQKPAPCKLWLKRLLLDRGKSAEMANIQPHVS